MNRNDVVMWKLNARIERRDHWVIPEADLAGVDSGKRGTIQLQILIVEARNIVINRLRGDCHSNIDNLGISLDVGVRHVGV